MRSSLLLLIFFTTCSTQVQPVSLGTSQLELSAMEQQTLLATAGEAADEFGTSVALSGDGNTALVGAPGDYLDAGAARMFTRAGQTWSEQQPLVAFDALLNDRFGASMALSTDGLHALAGVPLDDTPAGGNAGSARPFTRMGGQGFIADTVLVAGDAQPNDFLGTAVAISADGLRAVAGAPGDDRGTVINAGSARVFLRTGTTWAEEAALASPAPALDAGLGTAVAINADGGTVLVGAPYENTDAGVAAGAGHLFVRSGTTWSEQAVLFASGAAPGDGLGFAVALSSDGTRALLGAPGDQSARVFVKSGGSWSEEATLAPVDDAGTPGFGSAVALRADGLRALVGSPQGRGGGGTARLYVWGGSWAPDSALTPALAVVDTRAGSSVALSADGNTALLGGPGYDVGAVVNAGGAWAFTVGGNAIGNACTMASQCQSGFCADGFCCDQVCGGAANDCLACSHALTGAADGTCAPAARGSVCRASLGPCDYDEKCDGVSTICPADVLEPAGVVCRSATDACDLPETCSGSAAMCPPDAVRPASYLCRPSTSVCDADDFCNGTDKFCRDTFKPADTVCDSTLRGPCDAPDLCSGGSAYCRPTFVSGVVCRAQVGACDLQESCSGTAADCPPDGVLSAGICCRSATASCDTPEVCDGVVATCPSDVTSCGPDGRPRGGCSSALGLTPLLALLLLHRKRQAQAVHQIR